MLPRVVRAWSAYAIRKRGLPEAAADQVDTVVEEMIPEFARLYATGERRSPATAAVAQLISEGVDPNDAGRDRRLDRAQPPPPDRRPVLTPDRAAESGSTARRLRVPQADSGSPRADSGSPRAKSRACFDRSRRCAGVDQLEILDVGLKSRTEAPVSRMSS